MDFAANGLGTKIRGFIQRRPWLTLAATTTVIVLAILLTAQVFFDMPKSLFFLLSGTFLLWTAVYWLFSRRVYKTPAKHLARWLLPWMGAVALFLAAVFFIDRGGWLWYQVTGYDVTLAEDYQDKVDITAAEFVAEHPEFEESASGVHLPQGEYTFTETVIVPQGTALTIDPGTVLRFGAARSLISYSPVWAQGTEAEPIRFTAQNPWLKWGVMAVVGSSTSVFEHIQLEHSRQALVNDVEFFAGLSLIEADGMIRRSTFENVFGKDAVNARMSDVRIQDNEFRNAFKDCLDLDGGSGEIRGNLFVDCDDEGIDLRDNEGIEVFDNTILDDRGGRLAADQNQDVIEAQNTLGFSN